MAEIMIIIMRMLIWQTNTEWQNEMGAYLTRTFTFYSTFKTIPIPKRAYNTQHDCRAHNKT